jgi:hypothetical protein
VLRLAHDLEVERSLVPESKKTEPKAVLDFIKKNVVKMLDLRFTDLPGLWHHVSYPIDQLGEESFEDRFGMHGSSIRGWAVIHESDMLLVPDPDSYPLDPYTEIATLVMVADVRDPVTKHRYDREPRYIAPVRVCFVLRHLKRIVCKLASKPGCETFQPQSERRTRREQLKWSRDHAHGVQRMTLDETTCSRDTT